MATECPLSLILRALVPEGQGHLLRWQSLPISLLPMVPGSRGAAWGTSCLDKAVGLVWSRGGSTKGQPWPNVGLAQEMEQMQRMHSPTYASPWAPRPLSHSRRVYCRVQRGIWLP